MLNKIAIKIECAREGLEVRRLLGNYHVTGISVTHTQDDIDEMGLNCYFIGDNELFICGWESEGTPHIEKLTAQEFIDKYTPKPDIDRQELIAQLQHYRETVIILQNSLSYQYSSGKLSEIHLDIARVSEKISELEEQLGWEL